MTELIRPRRATALLVAGALALAALAAPPGSARAQSAAPAPEAPTTSTLSESAPGDPLDALLAEFSLTRRDLAPDPLSILLRRGANEDPALLHRFLLRPLEAPYVTGHIASQSRHWRHSIVRSLLLVISRAPAEISRGYLGNPLREAEARLAEAPDPLSGGLEAIWRAAGAAPSDEDRAQWARAAAPLPREWQCELGRLLAAAAAAAEWRAKAFAAAPSADLAPLSAPAHELWGAALGRGGPRAPDLRPLARSMDFDYLFAGALDLAVALEDFEDFLAAAPAAPPDAGFQLATPLGFVAFEASGGNTTYDTAASGHPLLIVDLGGDDQYLGAGLAAGPERPLHLVVDRAGNDTYVTPEGPSLGWGGGVGGYGAVLDLAGDDFHRAPGVSQGAGLFGVGLWIDRAGGDTAEGVFFCQGAGGAGAGLLLDLAGNDRREALACAQGLGAMRGSGALLDFDGDDTYTLYNEEPILPSAQAPASNSSMGQGMGLGLRADLEDGHSVAGGVGLLLDGAGNDHYKAGVFAQGSGFLGGAGILVDESGDDTYEAVYYAQGASAHSGAGILVDRAGDDTYSVQMQCAQGCGHDLGLGWLLDLAGNDRYRAARLAMGAANENGWGFFVDLAGDDTYEITAPPAAADSLGAAKLEKFGTLREDTPALGLFLDAGGRDAYTGAGRREERDNGAWVRAPRSPSPGLRCDRAAGRDGEFPRVDLRTGPLTAYPQSEFDFYRKQQPARRQYRATLAPPSAP